MNLIRQDRITDDPRKIPMITMDELAGIIDALGALSESEICAVAQEISFLRKEDFSPDIVTGMCRKALDEHLLELISPAEAIPGGAGGIVPSGGSEGTGYYIPGPNAFPDVPFELSEAIDILMLDKREVDWEKVAVRFCTGLQLQAVQLGESIISLSGSGMSESELSYIAELYSSLLNLYYDYDSWLPGGMEGIEDELQKLSGKLEQLRAAQGI